MNRKTTETFHDGSIRQGIQVSGFSNLYQLTPIMLNVSAGFLWRIAELDLVEVLDLVEELVFVEVEDLVEEAIEKEIWPWFPFI
jgi:hypothetical protein